MSKYPPEKLPDWQTPKQEADSLKLADEFATPGTVAHFAFRLGFMAHNEEQAEAIIKRMLQECVWWQNEYEDLHLSVCNDYPRE